MIEFVVLTALVLVTMGVVIGVIAVVSFGIHHEERDHSLESDAQDRITRGTRRMTGLSCSRLDASMLSHNHNGTTRERPLL
jgi:hypothetical protein